MLIYQDEFGDDNTNKTPKGGVIVQGSAASSMLDAINNPITYYGAYSVVINQAGHSGDLYNYYWISYSRGTDGRLNGSTNEPLWHNVYLDGYIPLRAKSIYDPCPYSYRIPSNGTWNQFNMQSGWTIYSYLGGVRCNINTLGESWSSSLGRRASGSSIFEEVGSEGYNISSTIGSKTSGYLFMFGTGVYTNQLSYARSYGMSVRCIEDCDPRADQTPTCDIYKAKHNPILLRKSPTAPTQ